MQEMTTFPPLGFIQLHAELQVLAAVNYPLLFLFCGHPGVIDVVDGAEGATRRASYE